MDNIRQAVREDTSAPPPSGVNAITPEALLDAVSKENAALHQRLYVMEQRLARFERIFSMYFEEELKDRLYSKGGMGADMCAIQPSPLAELRFKSGL